jgi:hypothetical protein
MWVAKVVRGRDNDQVMLAYGSSARAGLLRPDDTTYLSGMDEESILGRGRSGRGGGRMVATSATVAAAAAETMTVEVTTKRPYCDDYVPRMVPMSPRSIFRDAVKASIVAFMPITFQLAAYLDKKEAAESRGEPLDEEFDVEEKLKEQMPVFREKFLRFWCTTSLKVHLLCT